MGDELGRALAAELRAAVTRSGENCKPWRTVTQRELADKLGMSQPAVSRYERDASRMPIDLLCRWCRCIGIEPDEVFRRAQARGFVLEVGG